MQLRDRTSGQRAAMVEAPDSSDTDDISEDEWTPYNDAQATHVVPQRTNNARQSRVKRPEMIETVFEMLDRADVFELESLKNLRLVSKKHRDLVDSVGATSSATFKTRAENFGPLQAWAAGGAAIQRTQTFSITGKVPPVLAGHLLMTICSEKPPISKLELNGVGDAGEVLLVAPFDHLCELTVTHLGRRLETMKGLLENPSFVGLRSLSVSGGWVEGPTLSAALARLSGLQSLHLLDMDIAGGVEHPEILNGCLESLKTLEIAKCSNIICTGLLHPHGPALAALRSLSLGRFQDLDACPCLANLTALSLDRSRVVSPAVSAALSGGPLERLILSGQGAFEQWEWNGLLLPHLTSLEVKSSSNNIMGDVATARLPALSSAKLVFDHQINAEGVLTFGSAFPCLINLTLEGSPPAEEAEDVLRALSTEVVPQLESFTWIKNYGDPIATTSHFLPKGSAGTAPAWPNLRSLTLRSPSGRDRDGADQESVFKALAHAAPHCPSLTTLKAKTYRHTLPEALETFAEAAKEVKAWPRLTTLGFHFARGQRARIRGMLREVWPGVVVDFKRPKGDDPY